MKKTLIILFLIAALLGLAVTTFASDPDRYETLLNAVTTDATAGTEVVLLYAANKFACTATWGGTVPTNISFLVQLSDESGVYDATGDAAITMTASPTRFYIVNKAGKYLRGYRVGKSGGAADTSITLKCKAIR